MMKTNKQCPYCGEEIDIETKRCPHCAKWLEPQPSTNETRNDQQSTEAISSLATKAERDNAASLEQSILTYQLSHLPKSKNVFLLGNVPEDVVVRHKKVYAKILPNEKILLVVNHKIIGSIGGYCWSGLCITNRFVYFKCLKDTFWSSLTGSSTIGVVPLNSIQKIEIGAHDHAYGTAYVGHQLVINGQVKGLLRMGGGVLCDEDMIIELKQLFKSISDE